MNIEQQLKGLEIKQSTTTLRADFEYLDDNINWYLIDEAILVTEIAPGLQYGTLNLKQFFALEHLGHYCFCYYRKS